MSRRFVVFGFFSFALVASACTSVHSSLTVNGRPFGPDQCRNTQDEEIYGVDLKDEQDFTLRLAVNVDETITVVVLPNDGSHPVAMTGCARVHLDHGDPDKTGHYNVSGDAELDCTSDRYTVRGRTTFDHCGHDF